MPQTIGVDNLYAKNISGVQCLSNHDGTNLLKVIDDLNLKVEKLTSIVNVLRSQFDTTGVEDGYVMSWNAEEKKWTPASLE
jgi:hypothetical protein